MRLLFVLLLIFNGMVALAQSSILKAGIVAYETNDYDKAVEKLSEAMQAPDLLKSKEVPIGWYHLGKVKSLLISNAMSVQDGDKLAKYKGYDLEAYECFKKALAKNPKDDLETSIIKEIKSISYVIFNSGNMEYLLGQNEEAINYYTAAAAISSKYGMRGDYQIYALRGQTFLATGDTTEAYVDMTKAIDRYEISPPEIPDASIGYAFYWKAIIERHSNTNYDKALTLTQEGTEFMQAEANRLKGMMDLASSDKRILAAQSEQFDNVLDMLNRFELEIYRSSPEKFEEAVAKFEKAIADNPNDANLYIVYGNLIEEKNIDEAYVAYKSAIELAPENETGHFNAGANRVNKGVEYARKSNDAFDFEEVNKWQANMLEEFAVAFPHLEKAHELDPSNIYVIDALLQVTLQLELMDEYKMYKEKRQALTGY